jgi:hypothetical protein
MTTSIRLRIYLNISTSENGELMGRTRKNILSCEYPKTPVKSRFFRTELPDSDHDFEA